jgi:hypothetical protein
MKLTEKEKQELQKMLDDQDKPQDTSWLMVEHYAKLSKKQNPMGLICKICYVTHLPKDCPHRKTETDEKKTSTNSSQGEK